MGRVEIPAGYRVPRRPGPPFIAADVSSKGVAANPRQGKIYLWDINTGRFLGGIAAEGFDSLVRFSPDGNLIAGADGAGRIQLWDVATRSPVGVPLQGVYVPPPRPLPAPLPDGYVTDMAFSADGSMLHVVDSQGHLRMHLIGVARIKQALCQEIGPLNPRDWQR
ncbi:WD40 repeat domain-containing protein [Nonomuraea sp. NPDC050153]|uniref:WD40 repeat domain-containing protein n=1 Tax=Nonomuraea sp. NPDC050153 TaxID=3364359 RepID=UPI0037AFAD35